MPIVREVARQTVTNITTWPGIAVGYVGRLVRPAAERPAPPYKTCAGCRRGARTDQQVPDPDQFVKKNPDHFTRVTNGTSSTPPSDVTPEQSGKVEVKLTDAAPVWCGRCGSWYHSVGCYSLHRAH